MKVWQDNGSSAFCVEIGYDWLKARHQGRVLEVSLERRHDFSLEPNSRKAAARKLQEFLHRSLLQPRARVLCAIPARGVSLRRLTIPVTNDDDRQKVLQLQIESEFPLAPEELAWGYVRLSGASAARCGSGQEQVLVAAVRKETVRDYAGLFEGCNATVVFTPAGLARALVCPHIPGVFAHLDIGSKQSEMVTVEDGVPVHLRVMHWPGANGPQRGAGLALSVSATADPTMAVMPVGEGAPSDASPFVRGGNGMGNVLNGAKLYVGPVQDDRFDEQTLNLYFNTSIERLEPRAAAGTTLAVAGLEKALQQGLPLPQLSAASESKRSTRGTAGPLPVKWAAAAAVLVLLALLFPYFAAAVHKPFLARKLAGLKVDRGRLAMIDSELEFLKYLKQSQAPYLDAIYFISRSAPPGTRFDLLALTRRGELSFKGSFRDPNQIADFRGKLLDTGFFSGIAVEEQTPSPDRQKFTVRMTATWKADQMREAAALAAAKEPERPKSLLMGGGMGPMMMPPDVSSGPPMGAGGITMGPGMPVPAGGAIQIAPGMMPPGAGPAGAASTGASRVPPNLQPSSGVRPIPVPTPAPPP